MTQEEKEILIKDLSCRQPYGIKVQIDQQGLQEHDNYWNGWNLDKEAQEVSGVLKYGVTLDCMAMVDGVIPFEFVRSYLFPMSSMTEEQKEEFNNILSSVGLCYAYDADNSIIIFSNSNYNKNNYISDFDKIEVWLNKNHFDYSGLIPMGLAKNATNLNIY
jgi:hypothetical protein